MKIPLPILKYDDIRGVASKFLKKYHPDENIPIPIEEIIDLHFKINIIPFPDLYKNYQIVGYTWSDLKNICVDEFVYKNRIHRYRFTLAHEIGHILLHRDVLKHRDVDSIADYLDFANSIDEEQRGWFESQANCFAGLVLVPSKSLREKFEEARKKIKNKNFSLSDPITRDYISEWISNFFQVSRQTVEIRLVYDGLLPKEEKHF